MIRLGVGCCRRERRRTGPILRRNVSGRIGSAGQIDHRHAAGASTSRRPGSHGRWIARSRCWPETASERSDSGLGISDPTCLAYGIVKSHARRRRICRAQIGDPPRQAAGSQIGTRRRKSAGRVVADRSIADRSTVDGCGSIVARRGIGSRRRRRNACRRAERSDPRRRLNRRQRGGALYGSERREQRGRSQRRYRIVGRIATANADQHRHCRKQ